MNEENIERWVEALRSGYFNQTTRFLNVASSKWDRKGISCLGIACELYRRHHSETEWLKNSGRWKWVPDDRVFGFLVSGRPVFRHYPPPEVGEWLGIPNKGWNKARFQPCIHFYTVKWVLGDDRTKELVNGAMDGFVLTAPFSIRNLNDEGVSFEKLADMIELDYLEEWD